MRAYGNCNYDYVKSCEILNDSAWIERKTYNYKLERFFYQVYGKRKNDTLKRADYLHDPLITYPEPTKTPYKKFNQRNVFDNIPLDSKLRLDSVFIIAGSCGKGNTHFTFKNDSIFVAKTKKHIRVSRQHDFFVPDTLHFKGAATDSLLQLIKTSLDITELEMLENSISMGSRPFIQVKIFANNQKFEANQNVFSYGVNKLIKLSSTIKKQDLK